MIRLLRAILLFAAPSVLLPFVLPNIAVGEPAAASAPAQSEHRWHMYRKGALDHSRDLVAADPEDWNPLAEPFSISKGWLKRANTARRLELARSHLYNLMKLLQVERPDAEAGGQ